MPPTATRRNFLSSLAGAAFAGAIPAARGDRGAPRVGVLGIRDGSVYTHWKSRFPDEFAAHGLHDGRNLRLLWYDVTPSGPRGNPGAASLLEASRERAAEMAAAGLDCMVANGEPHARLLHEASRTIPIVVDVPDPVGLGFAQSLSRPGGNVTGLHGGVEEVALKTVELLRKLVPKLSGVAWIGWENFRASSRPVHAAAAAMGLKFRAVVLERNEPAGILRLQEEIATLRRAGYEAAQLAPFNTEMTRAVADSAMRNRIALAGGPPDLLGILLEYRARRGPEQSSARRVPSIVARVLRGERPGTIPFEGPSRYELAVNLKTAARIGIAVPTDVLVIADSVIRP